MDREFIKVNRDIQERKRVNVMFDILHVFCDGPSTLLRTDKILTINSDSSVGGRGICLLEGGPRSLRCGGGREKLHEHVRDRSNNCIKKQLFLSKPKSIILIWGGKSSIGQSYHLQGTQL